MRHAVIMAGGSGTRLWPLSRRDHPKQLLRLFEGRSLLRRSFERLTGLLEPAQIRVITGREHLEAVAAELPELPRRNLIGEPCGRDTANAVGLAACLLAREDPDGTMGVFTADHIITPEDVFRDAVARGFQTAERFAGALVTFGIRPTSAHTGYGYIHRGRELEPGVFEVLAFREKPDAATAEAWLAGGEHDWNSGMFAWRIPTILEEFQRHEPEALRTLREVAAGFDDPARTGEPDRLFAGLRRISVDYAILEKARQVLCVRMPCRWVDVGSWTSLADVLGADADGNVRAAPQVVALDAAGNVFVGESDHLLAAIGVQDLIVVHSPDATLVCRRQDAQRIKELVEHLRSQGEHHLL